MANGIYDPEEAHAAAAAEDLESLALNVGGQEFVTTRRTLMAEPSLLYDAASATYSVSFLPHKRLDKSHPAVMKLGMSRITYKDCFQGTSLAIDRDGTHFRHVLNYLRDGNAVLPSDSRVLRELLVEARAYELASLVNKINNELRDY